jgi:hypothetical protein
MDWMHFKDVIEAWTGLERDALHIYAAVIGQVAAAALLRRTLASPFPWLLVLLAALGNEWLDMYRDSIVEAWEAPAGLHDIWNSMLLPTVILLVARYAPGLVSGRPRESGEFGEPPESP